MITNRTLHCVAACVLILSSCALDGQIVNSKTDKDGNPLWVSSGSQSISSGDKRIFHGVGKATLEGDITKQTSVADRRAIYQINQLLSAYIKVVSRNYIASGRAHESGFGHFQASKHIAIIADYNKPSAKVIGHWRDKKNNTVYAIAELDLTAVKTTLNPGVINSGFISYINIEGDHIFDGFASK